MIIQSWRHVVPPKSAERETQPRGKIFTLGIVVVPLRECVSSCCRLSMFHPLRSKQRSSHLSDSFIVRCNCIVEGYVDPRDVSIVFFASFGVEATSEEAFVVDLRRESAASMLSADVAIDMLQSSQSSRQVLVFEYYARKQRFLDVKMKCFE